MRSRPSLDVVVRCLCRSAVRRPASLAQSANPMARPRRRRRWPSSRKPRGERHAEALPVISPRGLKLIANEGVTGVLMVLAFSDPDDAMPGSAKPAKAELDAKRKKYKEAVDLAKAVLKPYGLDTMIGKPVLAPRRRSRSTPRSTRPTTSR